MKFISTRNRAKPLGFSQAIRQGLASDGGLYVPQSFSHFDMTADLARLVNLADLTLSEVSQEILKKISSNDPLFSLAEEICSEAFDFALPLKQLNQKTSVLELYHGPTAAFKDVGARFLASCLARAQSAKPDIVLVATSGDTGGAVASAFFKKPQVKVVILFPENGVSPRQRQQLSCWGENILSLAVSGTFDDCQALVKRAFVENTEEKSFHLLSANSINIGRILPQSFYYAWAALEYQRRHQRTPGFVVPSGNLGNAVAALWAKQMGFPIGKIVLACNANHAVVDFVNTGNWQPQSTIRTLANAMDVGNASNMERLQNIYTDRTKLLADVAAFSVLDSEIQQTIQRGENDWGEVWCPHTACAVASREKLKEGDWIIVATAHPAKFEQIVEPLVGHALEVPSSFSKIINLPEKSKKMTVSYQDLMREIIDFG